VQLIAYGVAQPRCPGLPRIFPPDAGPATFMAALSITVGIINAACMSTNVMTREPRTDD